ncbi:TIGR03619 family F420-dependent LLM class oxidoreductase [Nocardia salmonicida]|uniref:TIGR03619 family F420-dependent LLM class oxidoreductase n=1 Tax=Nocardia salmonicida TaxID=53431 RepID=UPI0034114A81
MKFYLSLALVEIPEIVEIAKAADELGYAGIAVPDHVVNFETLATPYPYSDDGRRRWEPFTEWPDPWVLIGAMAACTRRLHFITTVYVAALRDPYTVAKAVATAAVLGGGRVELGLGAGWCAEEFELMNAEFSGRGKRTEEMVDLMRELWLPGWTEFSGRYYTTPRLEMTPTPPPIPVMFGGLTDLALRRAARYDGWIGDRMTIQEAIEVAGTLRRYRTEHGLPFDTFSILAPLTDAWGTDRYLEAEAAGITHMVTKPWVLYYGRNATLDQKIEALHRFRHDNYPAAFAPSAVPAEP